MATRQCGESSDCGCKLFGVGNRQSICTGCRVCRCKLASNADWASVARGNTGSARAGCRTRTTLPLGSEGLPVGLSVEMEKKRQDETSVAMREQPKIPEEYLRACLQDQYELIPVTLEFLPRGKDYHAGVYRVVSEQ